MSKINHVFPKMRGDYAKFSEYMRSKRIFTISELIGFGKSIGKTPETALYTIRVLCSPRLTARIGCDPRGSVSCPWGHLAYVDKLNRRVINGVKEEQRFQFRWREIPLEPRERTFKIAVKATVTVTTKDEAVASTKSRSKVNSRAAVKDIAE